MGKSPQVGRLSIEDEAEQLDFGSAMNKLLEGVKVRRLGWLDGGVYLTMENELLMIYKTDDSMLHPLIVSVGDIAGQDWVVIGDNKPESHGKTIH